MNDISSSLDGKHNDAIVFKDTGVPEIDDLDGMKIDDDYAIQDDHSFVSQTPETILCTSKFIMISASTNAMPFHLTLPSISDHKKLLIYLTVTSSKTASAPTLSA